MNEKAQNHKATIVLALRFLQLLTTALFIVGFIWGSSDYLTATILKDVPIAPLSVLFMLYGFVGSISIEAAIRIVQRKK